MADLYSLHMMVTLKIRSKSPNLINSLQVWSKSFTGSEEDRTETKQRVKADMRIHKQTRNIYVSPCGRVGRHIAFQSWGRLHANVIDYNYNYFGIS